MMMPTTYQRTVIAASGYDPDTWWPVEWNDTTATLRNRATNEMVTLENIEGRCEDNICRNLANDAEDPTHGYVPQITINQGGPR